MLSDQGLLADADVEWPFEEAFDREVAESSDVKLLLSTSTEIVLNNF